MPHLHRLLQDKYGARFDNTVLQESEDYNTTSTL